MLLAPPLLPVLLLLLTVALCCQSYSSDDLYSSISLVTSKSVIKGRVINLSSALHYRKIQLMLIDARSNAVVDSKSNLQFSNYHIDGKNDNVCDSRGPAISFLLTDRSNATSIRPSLCKLLVKDMLTDITVYSTIISIEEGGPGILNTGDIHIYKDCGDIKLSFLSRWFLLGLIAACFVVSLTCRPLVARRLRAARLQKEA